MFNLVSRSRLLFLIALVGGLLTSGTAYARWGFTGWEPARCDLVVVGTLSEFKGEVAAADGAVYETTLGTIDVERVVYSREGAEVPASLQLYSGQLANLICPRISHEAHLHERGAWLLTKTNVEGVYSASRPTPLLELAALKSETPRVRLAEATLDAASGVVELRLRFENFSPEPITFPSPLPLIVEGRSDWGDDPKLQLIEVTPSQVTLPPWRFSEETIRVTLPPSVRSRNLVYLRPSTGERASGCLVERIQSGGGSPTSSPSLWLAPDTKKSLSVGYPSPLLLMFGVILGALPLTTRGRNWSWRPRSVNLGTFLATGSLSLLPWSVLGLFSATQIVNGFQRQAPLVVGAFAVHLLAVGLMWQFKRSFRPAVVAGALAPLLLIAGSYVLLLTLAKLGLA